MSDPNQPYGAPPPVGPPPGSAPPPSFPPPGFPPPGGPPGPGFPPPGGPAGPGQGKGRGLWIALGIVGALALVGVVIALVLLLVGSDGDDKGDDNDTGKGTDDNSAGVDGAAPDEVVESLVEAAEGGDCDLAKTFLTETAQAADPCNAAEFRLLSTEDVESEIGEPAIDDGRATVPVGFTSSQGSSDYVFNLEQVDGAWLIASYAIDHDSDTTDGASDGSTDASTDGATDDPTPEGSSTADAVANDPKSVVEAFLDAVVSGDCATAEDLVTAAYLEEEGDCDASDLPSGFADQVVYTVGTPKVDDAAGTATVPVEVSFSGQEDTSTVELVKESGQWRISAFD